MTVIRTIYYHANNTLLPIQVLVKEVIIRSVCNCLKMFSVCVDSVLTQDQVVKFSDMILAFISDLLFICYIWTNMVLVERDISISN